MKPTGHLQNTNLPLSTHVAPLRQGDDWHLSVSNSQCWPWYPWGHIHWVWFPTRPHLPPCKQTTPVHPWRDNETLQVSPVKPGEQTHWKPPGMSRQVPLWRHGDELHLLSFISQWRPKVQSNDQNESLTDHISIQIRQQGKSMGELREWLIPRKGGGQGGTRGSPVKAITRFTWKFIQHVRSFCFCMCSSKLNLWNTFSLVM